MKARDLENKEVVRILLEKILRRTTLRKKRVSFKEEIEDLGLDQQSGEWLTPERDIEEESLFGESLEGVEKRRYNDTNCKLIPHPGRDPSTWSIMM